MTNHGTVKYTVSIKETKTGGSIKVVDNFGKTHTGKFTDDGEVRGNGKSNEKVLAAALVAWSGQESPFVLTYDQLKKTGYL